MCVRKSLKQREKHHARKFYRSDLRKWFIYSHLRHVRDAYEPNVILTHMSTTELIGEGTKVGTKSPRARHSAPQQTATFSPEMAPNRRSWHASGSNEECNEPLRSSPRNDTSVLETQLKPAYISATVDRNLTLIWISCATLCIIVMQRITWD